MAISSTAGIRLRFDVSRRGGLTGSGLAEGVGFVNSAVADLQGNRPGARVALVADRMAAVMLAMAAQLLARMVSSGRKRRAERVGFVNSVRPICRGIAPEPAEGLTSGPDWPASPPKS